MKIRRLAILILITVLTGCANTPEPLDYKDDIAQLKKIVSSHLEKAGDPNFAYSGTYRQNYSAKNHWNEGSIIYGTAFIDGYTLLKKAVFLNDLEVAKQLLKAGADPNLVVVNGTTATPTAIFYVKSREMVELLTKSGADVNHKLVKNEEMFTPLLNSVDYIDGSFYPEAISALLDAGADSNIKYINKSSPFHGMTARSIVEKKKELFLIQGIKDAKKDIYDEVIAVFVDLELKPLFESVCKRFSYKKCKSFANRDIKTPLTRRAAQLVKEYEENEAVVMFNNLCGYNGSFTSCNIFLNNHNGLFKDSETNFLLSYHSKGVTYQEIQNNKSPESEFIRMRYCSGDPLDYSELEDLIEFANDGCRTQIRRFSDTVREYLESGSSGEDYEVEDDYHSAMHCIREKRDGEINRTREHYAKALSEIKSTCLPNNPATKYAAQLNDNITRVEEAMDDLPKLSSQINSMMKKYERQKNRPARVQKSWIGELASAMAEIDGGHTSMIEFTPGLTKSDQMFLENQQKLKDIAQGKSSYSGTYGAGGNSMSASSGSSGGAGGKQEKSELYEFTCPNPPNAKSQSIELPYYTTSCLAALKRFYKTHACNLIDDMPKVEQDCTQACGRPDCMESP